MTDLHQIEDVVFERTKDGITASINGNPVMVKKRGGEWTSVETAPLFAVFKATDALMKMREKSNG